MTDLERWKIERDALDQRIADEEANQACERAREVFRRLGAEKGLPVMEIVDLAMADFIQTDPERAVKFTERLAACVKAHSR